MLAYNSAARALDPPRDTLDWQKVTHFSFIDQFDILRDTRHGVLDKPWAKPLNRELMMSLHRVARAREEIPRLNIEIRRLHTFIVDEEKHFDMVLGYLRGEPMYAPVLDHVSRRKAVNKMLLLRLNDIYALPGFTGDPTAGITKHPFPNPTPNMSEQQSSGESATNVITSNVSCHNSLPITPEQRKPDEINSNVDSSNSSPMQLASDSEGEKLDEEGPLEDDDEYTDNVRAVIDFISNLTV